MSSADAEVATFTAQAKAIGALPIVYPDDHTPDPEEVDIPRKLAPLPVGGRLSDHWLRSKIRVRVPLIWLIL